MTTEKKPKQVIDTQLKKIWIPKHNTIWEDKLLSLKWQSDQLNLNYVTRQHGDKHPKTKRNDSLDVPSKFNLRIAISEHTNGIRTNDHWKPIQDMARTHFLSPCFLSVVSVNEIGVYHRETEQSNCNAKWTVCSLNPLFQSTVGVGGGATFFSS